MAVEGSQRYEGLTVPQDVKQFKNVYEGDAILEDKLLLHVDQNVKLEQMPVRKPPITLRKKYKMEV